MKDTIFVYIYGYLPGIKYGGPVTSISNFTEHFGDKYDIRIVCSNHDHGERKIYPDIKPGWNQVGKASVLYLSESEYGISKFTEIMKPFKVKMVYLTGVFSFKLNHAAIKAANKLGIKVVIATRGEICKNVLAMKSYKKLPYLRVMKWAGEYSKSYFQVTSQEEMDQLEKYLNIPQDRIMMLPNIHGKAMNLPRPQKEVGKAKLLFVSRVHPKKNLIEAIEALTQTKGEIQFDIYGPIEDEKYWDECQTVIKRLPDNVNVAYKGSLNAQEARACYYGYHAFVFPTLSENYGHVIVESMIADCPIVISRGTTPWDDADGAAGYVVELHDISALAKAIQKIVDMASDDFLEVQKTLRVYRDNKLRLQDLVMGYEQLIRFR